MLGPYDAAVKVEADLADCKFIPVFATNSDIHVKLTFVEYVCTTVYKL